MSEMTKERWQQLMDDEGPPLTDAEYAEGWHFCPEMDGLLMGPDDLDNQPACFCGHRAESQDTNQGD